MLTLSTGTTLDARAHEGTAVRVERGERRHCLERGSGEHVCVALEHTLPNA